MFNAASGRYWRIPARDAAGLVRITLTATEELLQQQAVLYDKEGDAHFNTISAFIKINRAPFLTA